MHREFSRAVGRGNAKLLLKHCPSWGWDIQGQAGPSSLLAAKSKLSLYGTRKGSIAYAAKIFPCSCPCRWDSLRAGVRALNQVELQANIHRSATISKLSMSPLYQPGLQKILNWMKRDHKKKSLGLGRVNFISPL